MKTRFKKVLCMALSATMALSLAAPIAGAANTGAMLISSAPQSAKTETVEIAKLDKLPDQDWYSSTTFPHTGRKPDDTLAMNSLFSFTCYADQGEVYLVTDENVESFRMFVNNAEINVTGVKANGVYKIDISDLTVDGTNTVQVSVVTPYTAKIDLYVPYCSIIDGKPEDVGMSADTVELINDFINSEVKYGFSGAQLAVIKDGKLVVNEAYGAVNGYRTDGTRIEEGDEDYVAVTTDTLYDLASNTKMYSVIYAIQYMISHGYDISLDDPITKFYPEFATATILPEGSTEEEYAQQAEWKAGITVGDVLKHEAGFTPDPMYHNNYYNQTTGALTDDPNANLLYTQDRETTLKMVLATPLVYAPNTKTSYSDADYMLTCFIVEQVAGMRIDEFLKETFWDPMGLEHITYNPLENGFEVNDCAATELNGNRRTDMAGNGDAVTFNNNREGVIQGTVHDEKAYYCMGGISGHAGLFSNAADLAKLASLMLTGGYEDNLYFTNDVIDTFIAPKSTDTTSWSTGWWHQGDVQRRSYYSVYASENTLGHQGWTGTLTMIDPDENLVVVLLTCTRNTPVMDNTVDANDFYGTNYVLGSLGIVNGLVYDSFKSSENAMDGKVAQMAYQRIQLSATHGGEYDVVPHTQDAFAFLDLAITRAEKKQTTETVNYANWVYDLMESYLFDEDGKKIDTYFGGNAENTANIYLWWVELTARMNKLEAVNGKSHKLSKMKAVLLDETPAVFNDNGTLKGGDQNAVFMPRAYGFSTGTVYDNTNFWFEGYEGQGTLYISRYNNAEVDLSNLEIFVNGHAVDVSAIKNNNKQGNMFAIDVSAYTVNGRNMAQFSGINNTSKGSLLVVAENPVVIEGTPDEVGMDQKALDFIDAIISSDVEHGFTSAQLAVVKDGKMIYSNAWGAINSYHSDGTRIEEGDEDYIAATTETLYDLASNTKMYSVNYALQHLVADGEVSLSDKITKFFPDFATGTIYPEGTSDEDKAQITEWKNALTVGDILMHQAGFTPDPQYHNNNFRGEGTTYELYAADHETALKMILATPLTYEPGTITKYSDVDYMLLGLIIEQITGTDLDTYLKETFYEPMGLENITYNPLDNGYTADQIAATELNGNSRDGAITFEGIREGVIQGTVHDEKAYYCMDGISGHAGLFATAEDLATLAQAMLNPSGYGSAKFFSRTVNEYFTSPKSLDAPNWGQGWWREADGWRPWYFGWQASRNTFGHQGWTGTLTQIDPEYELTYAYLTNKINSPVTDNTVDTNTFDGEAYVSSTLGFLPAILYIGMEENNVAEDIQPALDALLADMVVCKTLRTIKDGDTAYGHPATDATYSLLDLLRATVEERPTAKNLAALKQAEYVVSTLWSNFSDVVETEWYTDAVKYAASNGLLKGMDDGSFGINETMNRAMLVTVLYRAAGEPEIEEGTVTGVVEGQYYTDAAKWAVQNGLLDNFRINRVPTREELALILYKFDQLTNEAETLTVDLSDFVDGDEVSDECFEAVHWAVQKGILKGTDEGYLKPNTEINRGEFATILMRYFG